MQWFKFYGGEYLSDPKILALSASERSCWITLLSYACVVENGGRVDYLSEQQLMVQAGITPVDNEWTETVGVLEKFAKLKMINLDSNGTITVSNWNKRQEMALTNAERQARHRERQKVTGMSQNNNARVEKSRVEKNNTASKEAKALAQKYKI